MLQPNFSPFPVLTTSNYILRQVTDNDIDELFNMQSDEKVTKYLDRDPAKSKEDAVIIIGKINTSLQNNSGIIWAISTKNNNTLIGTIGFWRIDAVNHRAEIGYTLQSAYHGKGIIREIFPVFIDWGFTILKLHSIEGRVNPNNAASIHILQKHGFIREAYFKEDFYYNGRFMDTAVYSLLKQ